MPEGLADTVHRCGKVTFSSAPMTADMVGKKRAQIIVSAIREVVTMRSKAKAGLGRGWGGFCFCCCSDLRRLLADLLAVVVRFDVGLVVAAAAVPVATVVVAWVSHSHLPL